LAENNTSSSFTPGVLIMDGFHDLGGFQGFGKVPHTINSLSYK
jgi:hypothetical protein